MALALERTEFQTTPKLSLSVCILDDDPAMVEVLQEIIGQFGFGSCGTSDPQRALAEIGSGHCHVALVDVQMPAMNGFEFLRQALERDPTAIVILITGYYSIEGAIEAIRCGAYDYLPKPIDRLRLKRSLEELAEQSERERRISGLEAQLLSDLELHGIVGRSPGMLELMDLVRKIARHYSNVLLTGPIGAGKKLVARALHQLSPAASQRLAVCNCSALVETLLESQLFGHVRGAFSGAGETRPGLFENANGGTVFLDEIGEMPLPLQTKLLRFIQNREVQRIGSPEVRLVDVRLIAATTCDLQAEVLAGRFRQDLFRRLSTVQLRVPSIQERHEDIPLLIAFFLRKYNQLHQKRLRGVTNRAKALLLRHNWPGNVRELEDVVASAVLVADGDFVDVSDLPGQLRVPPSSEPTVEGWQPLPLERVRTQHIKRMLDLCGGNRVRAAQLLGIGRTSLYRHLKRSSDTSSLRKLGAMRGGFPVDDHN
jgi:DNA-binding NtrC family response regulator